MGKIEKVKAIHQLLIESISPLELFTIHHDAINALINKVEELERRLNDLDPR